MDAEEYTEKLAAPAPGQTALLSRGPLVEANLSLYRASDNFLYTLGLDYFEDPDGGFENVRIPAGTMLRAEYVYHAEPAIGEGFIAAAAAPAQLNAGEPARLSAGAIRYATLVKMGA